MTQFNSVYEGKRVLVTGHTGFKGSWLTLWLTELGAQVTGVSLDPETSPNHWDLLGLNVDDRRTDIRDAERLKQIMLDVKPEIVFHLAAQALVRRSYSDPLDTWSTNVLGTANVLDACRQAGGVKTIVVVTTDKCYQNQEWAWGYREIDPLGGHDPYSASKAGAELVAASYRKSFFQTEMGPLLATARAGNVIGGGDWSQDRLIPDLVHALEAGRSLEIRSPLATRPWQHVLECLSGYLLLGSQLELGNKAFADAWNFGPDPNGNRTVTEVLEKLNHHWSELNWNVTRSPQPHEANLLYLDCSKSRTQLHWQPVWDIDLTIEKTAVWYRAWSSNRQVISREQLVEYVSTAAIHGAVWVNR